ncbi:hypothetical protein XBKB1_890005 [Xenorhabdus bovienii str. kraussei Becker Underwood]|uniref:Uncharacterized protein n=1 Tax=Xenorhabdus bovienii str. kraussei Becker Underwood TaxID=1398204 RepID=A0A077Q111_XENBV|nr:hypothetical protein XBKB1_890005 [Xenorhabdus bovienii str. kraussei Becker Underwood]
MAIWQQIGSALAALYKYTLSIRYLFSFRHPAEKNIFHIKKAHQIESQCAFVDYLFSLANQKDITVC